VLFKSIVLVNARGKSRGGRMGRSTYLKTHESHFIHDDFVQIGKQHSRYKAILPSIVLSQQWFEVYFILLR